MTIVTRECLRQYDDETAEQLELFGAESMSAERLVEAYMHRKGASRAQALQYILAREDREGLLRRITNHLLDRLLSGGKRTDVRVREFAQLMSTQSKGLQALWHFAMSQLKHRRRD